MSIAVAIPRRAVRGRLVDEHGRNYLYLNQATANRLSGGGTDAYRGAGFDNQVTHFWNTSDKSPDADIIFSQHDLRQRSADQVRTREIL